MPVEKAKTIPDCLLVQQQHHVVVKRLDLGRANSGHPWMYCADPLHTVCVDLRQLVAVLVLLDFELYLAAGVVKPGEAALGDAIA